MSKIREILATLTRPLGASADGGKLGVGLSAAMVRAEQGLSDEVEHFLRAKRADASGVSH